MLQINDPCPVNTKRLRKIGENCYFCKGCNEKVIDFTKSTDAEILSYKGQKICGIFREDQLGFKPVFNWRKAILFRLLTFASFLGFAVFPVYGDEQSSPQTEQVGISIEKKKKYSFKPRKKKKRRKHSNTRTKGTPTWM